VPIKTVKGAAISYEDDGRGKPVVLVHGFPLDARIFDDQVTALAPSYRVIRPDLRGFGKSRSADSFTVASLADDLHALLRELDILPCVLGGLSMGGYVALAHARKYGRDLRGLILLDTRSEADNADGRAARDKMIDLVRKSGSAAVAGQMLAKMLAPENRTGAVAQRLNAIMESQSPITIEHALEALRDRKDYSGDLASISAPTLIIVGDKDELTPPEKSRKLNESIPRSTLSVIPSAGHLSTMEQPQAVNKAIQDFLMRLP